MRLRSFPVALAATLILATPAHAADPIEGATYEGTTDTGSPFSFKVSGGKVTDVVTSAPLTCVGPEGGVEIYAIVSKTPFNVAGGAISGKDETADPRLEMREASFTSATEAKGKLDALTTKFKVGEGVTSCIREIVWTAKTTSAPASATPAPAAPATPAPQIVGGPTVAAPAALLGTLSRARIARTINVPIQLTVPATATLAISAKDAKRYRVSRTIGRASAKAGATRLTFRQSAKTVKRLRRAKRLQATVRVKPAGAAVTTGRLTLTQ